MNTISVGPITLQGDLLILLLAIFGGLLFMSFQMKRNAKKHSTLNDMWINTAILFILTLKLSPLLYAPTFFIRDPILLLFYPIDQRQMLIALICSLLFVAFYTYKKKLDILVVSQSFIYFYLSGSIIYLLAASRPSIMLWGLYEATSVFLIYQLIVATILLTWTIWTKLETKAYLIGITVMYGLAQTVALLFKL